MLVYSTKAILCGGKDGFTIPCHKITDAPDWITKTTAFKMGLEDGCLTVTNTKEKKIAAENGDLAKSETKSKK